MILVDRGGEPDYLRKHKARLLADLLSARAAEAQATKDDKLKASKLRKACEKKYNQKTVKSKLRSAFHGKCAYCESRVNHVAYPQIEHFEPKELSPDQTFEWSNFRLACGICNGPSWKGNKSPAAAPGGPVLDPCGADLPEDHLRFQYDSQAKTASLGWKTPRGESTIAFFGLNSAQRDLLVQRSRHIERILAIGRNASTDPELAAIWRDAKAAAQDGSEEYSAWVRAEINGVLEIL